MTDAATDENATRLRIRSRDVMGIFDLSRYGPCGTSVCIKVDGEDGWMTPTEFRAKSRGGSHADAHVWKRVIRLTDYHNRSLRWLLNRRDVRQCAKGCHCQNCLLAQAHKQSRRPSTDHQLAKITAPAPSKPETDSDSGISNISGLSSAELTREMVESHPDYPAMVREAVRAITFGQESGSQGCSRLSILLYILSKFEPREKIEVVNEKVKSATRLLRRMGVVGKLGEGDSDEDSDVEEKEIEFKPKMFDGEGKAKRPAKVLTQTGNGDQEKAGKKKMKKGIKSKENRNKKKGNNGVINRNLPMYKPKVLSPELSAICGGKKMTRNEVVSKMWKYVKKYKLQDPDQKTRIICDQKLGALTKQPSINQTALLSYIGLHLS